MKRIIITISNLSKFPIPCSKGGIWQPLNNLTDGKGWLQLEAEEDLKANGITFTKKVLVDSDFVKQDLI